MRASTYDYPYLNVIRRERWGALPRQEGVILEPMDHPILNVIFTYYTGTKPCNDRESCQRTVRELQKKYLDEGHPDLPYNFLVGGDLNVYEARGWGVKPVKHDKFPQVHDSSVEVAYIGNYKDEISPLSMGVKAMKLVNSGVHHNLICVRYEIYEDGEDYDATQFFKAANIKPVKADSDESKLFEDDVDMEDLIDYDL